MLRHLMKSWKASLERHFKDCRTTDPQPAFP
jgi:hypothetical protein